MKKKKLIIDENYESKKDCKITDKIVKAFCDYINQFEDEDELGFASYLTANLCLEGLKDIVSPEKMEFILNEINEKHGIKKPTQTETQNHH